MQQSAIILSLTDEQSEALRPVLDVQKTREKGRVFSVVNPTLHGVQLDAVWLPWKDSQQV